VPGVARLPLSRGSSCEGGVNNYFQELEAYTSCVRRFHRPFDTSVDMTPLYSLREHAIAKEPGSSYPERWPCVSRLGASMVAQAPRSLPRM
jgi:hypothetical protein